MDGAAPGALSAFSNRLVGPLGAVLDAAPSGWRPVIDAFAASPAGRSLREFVDARLQSGACCYPATPLRALELVAPAEVRVAILGQDPYHGPGQANGLAFSVAPGQKPPPSLRNLLKEVHADIGTPSQCRDDLTPWAEQGVLLLNSALTVEQGAPQSHAGHGWEALTDALLARVADELRPVVFVLWGAAAQRKRALVERAHHLRSDLEPPLAAVGQPSARALRRQPTVQPRECVPGGAAPGKPADPVVTTIAAASCTAILRGSTGRGGRVVNGSRL